MMSHNVTCVTVAIQRPLRLKPYYNIFSDIIMARKFANKKRSNRGGGRRRLQPTPAPTYIPRAPRLRGRPATNPYTSPDPYVPSRRTIRNLNWKIKSRAAMRVQQSDNIVTLPAFKVGKPRKVPLSEKITRLTTPQNIFKRVWTWSSECDSGRKGWFGIPINDLKTTVSAAGGTLYNDAIENYQRLTTESTGQDPTVVTAGQVSGKKVYVDYYGGKLQMINSGTNSVTGRIHLVRYKRDCESTFANVNVPLVPINMMGYAQNEARGAYLPQNDTVGQGFRFDFATAGVDLDANYDMPGSTFNSGGATFQTDPHLELFGSQVKNVTSYFFHEVASQSFSLKPGQQVNLWTLMHDLPFINRSALDMVYIRGVTYYLVVEFQGQVVGSSVAANTISTGTGQLSCIYEEKRTLGLQNKYIPKIYNMTPALSNILVANQQTINPDTGVIDIGYEDDA